MRKVGLIKKVFKEMEVNCFSDIIDDFTDQIFVFDGGEEHESEDGFEGGSEDEWETESEDGEEDEEGDKPATKIPPPQEPTALVSPERDEVDEFFEGL